MEEGDEVGEKVRCRCTVGLSVCMGEGSLVSEDYSIGLVA